MIPAAWGKLGEVKLTADAARMKKDEKTRPFRPFRDWWKDRGDTWQLLSTTKSGLYLADTAKPPNKHPKATSLEHLMDPHGLVHFAGERGSGRWLKLAAGEKAEALGPGGRMLRPAPSWPSLVWLDCRYLPLVYS